MPKSCSRLRFEQLLRIFLNFPRASYLYERMMTYEPIVNFNSDLKIPTEDHGQEKRKS